jgi:CDP-paratose 2-epimerase
MKDLIMKRLLITGSSGLIGSEAVMFFDKRGWRITGIDNNMRFALFGPDGDTSHNLTQLCRTTKHFTHVDLDIRNRSLVFDTVGRAHPNMVIHAAAQPSHDLARERPFDDFEINAVGTLNLLEATRCCCPDSPFIFMSTNKVYGDTPNKRPLVEFASRWDYAATEDYHGVNETCPIDQSLHSLFGVSKTSADLLVQEYGRYFHIPTVCLRAGCLTGPNQCGVELHGFLSYLARSAREQRVYQIFGYRGKQVRDAIHSYDVCAFFQCFYEQPRVAAVYNIGGGRENSTSVIEAISKLDDFLGRKLQTVYVDAPRVGDHICYISDLRRIRSDYPNWEITRSLDRILKELALAASTPSTKNDSFQPTCSISSSH